MSDNTFLRRLGIEHPIIAAPMGGGPSTPELVAAVSNAGGLGSLAGAYLTPGQIADEIGRVRALTGRPFAVNLFAGGYHTGFGDPAPMLALMREVHHELGLPEPEVAPVPADPFPAQLRVVLDARPAAFSFTFGIPPSDALRDLREAGIVVMGTATTVEEGRLLAEAGVDAIVAQGAEAGAHRGTFTGDFERAMVPTLELTAGIAAATGLPVIASGGVMDGRDVAAALDAGAAAVQMGTAFVPCPESGAAEAYKQAILSATEDRTVITRAFSGRPARGIENTFIRRVEPVRDAILPFPAQNNLTRPMRAAAGKRGEPGYLSLWAGTEAHRARTLPAADLVRVLVEEMQQARSPSPTR